MEKKKWVFFRIREKKRGLCVKRYKYDLFTICLVPGLTMILASFDSWTQSNLSVLGNRKGNEILFGIWGMGLGAYYWFYMEYLFHKAGYKGRAGRRWLASAAVFLSAAVCLPYLPGRYPLLSAFHVLFAFFSPIFVMVSLVCFLCFLSRRDVEGYRKAWVFLISASAAGFVLFAVMGFITSLLEVFVVLCLCGFLRYLEGRLEKEKAEEKAAANGLPS